MLLKKGAGAGGGGGEGGGGGGDCGYAKIVLAFKELMLKLLIGIWQAIWE